MAELKKPSVVYDTNQGEILLAYKRKVVMRTKHIDISHQFMEYMLKDKYIDITYMISE